MAVRTYENIKKTSENREKARSYYIPYESMEKALAGKKEESAYYKLLNGMWDFRYFERDIDEPSEITEWDKTPVPSCWQMQGYDRHQYTNLNYQFNEISFNRWGFINAFLNNSVMIFIYSV